MTTNMMNGILFGFILIFLINCGEKISSDLEISPYTENIPLIDNNSIINQIFDNIATSCRLYVNTYTSAVIVIQRSETFDGQITVTDSNSKCLIVSNAIPNHNFNDISANFATPVAQINQSFEFAKVPSVAINTTALSLAYDNAIFLNGVKLDLLAAACYGVGDGKVDCGDAYMGKTWRYDPMSPLNNFGTDLHHAHIQPNGTYHYHAAPDAIYEVLNPSTISGVIGFAADGFPIFGQPSMTMERYKKQYPVFV